MSTNQFSNHNFRSNSRSKTIRSFIVLIIMVVAVLAGVSQIKVVREFFSQASGMPANIVIATQTVLGPMPRPWRYLAQGGEDHAWRMTNISAQVKALNPEYIRLDHIYDFYDIVEGSPGNISFNFSKFDAILDDIKAVGAKPYIALSYMPPAISKGDIVDAPHNWADWQLTIQKTIEHVSGTLQIRDVYYEVWNEPDLFGGWKYYGDKNYLTMYSYAAQGAINARRNPRVLPFKFGGPGITALYKNWFDALAKHAINNRLPYDFFSWHRYNRDIEQFQKDMNEASAWLEKYPQLAPVLELHITEWGHDSENDPGYDTHYSAAHTVAGAIAMVPTVQKAFVFEIQDGKGPEGQSLWGRWGMISHESAGNQLKPRYHALKMLDSIADQRLQLTGQGSWVKALAGKNELGNTEFVMANFDRRGSYSENVPVTFTDIQPGNYTLKLQFLNGQNRDVPLATDSAVLQTQVMMPANSVVKGELVGR